MFISIADPLVVERCLSGVSLTYISPDKVYSHIYGAIWAENIAAIVPKRVGLNFTSYAIK